MEQRVFSSGTHLAAVFPNGLVNTTFRYVAPTPYRARCSYTCPLVCSLLSRVSTGFLTVGGPMYVLSEVIGKPSVYYDAFAEVLTLRFTHSVRHATKRTRIVPPVGPVIIQYT